MIIKKYSHSLFYIILFFLVFGVSCSRKADIQSGASPVWEGERTVSIAVEGMTVSSSQLINEIKGNGLAEGIREAWVVSETQGLVKSINFNLGDRVAANQILLSVDDNLARRNKDLADQQYKTALLEFKAAEVSFKNGNISALQFSQNTEKFLAAEVSKAAGADAFNKTSLRTPFSGVIALRDRNIGIGTLLNPGVRVARIVDNSAFRAEISVGEGQVLLVKEGVEARIIGNDGIERIGRVIAVSAGSESSSGSYIVVVEWIPKFGDPLRSGMSVSISLSIESENQKIIIPASSIRLRGGEEYVFIAQDSKVEIKKIKTGSRLGDRIEVLQGLFNGEILITSGLASLTPGASVTVSIIGNSGDI